eukprot:1159212-Pelagomonas_calceolata.AAC.7
MAAAATAASAVGSSGEAAAATCNVGTAGLEVVVREEEMGDPGVALMETATTMGMTVQGATRARIGRWWTPRGWGMGGAPAGRKKHRCVHMCLMSADLAVTHS